MQVPTFYQAIIQALNRAYVRVSLAILHKRVTKYHTLACQATKPHPLDIKTSLKECVAEMLETSSDGYGRESTINIAVGIAPFSYPPHGDLEHTSTPRKVNKENVKELSRYFKSASGSAELHPDIENKLEHSTWEHIHTAMRQARSGNKRGAKMHVDIACSACRELAHFKNAEQYQSFLIEVEHALEKLRVKKPVASA